MIFVSGRVPFHSLNRLYSIDFLSSLLFSFFSFADALHFNAASASFPPHVIAKVYKCSCHSCLLLPLFPCLTHSRKPRHSFVLSDSVPVYGKHMHIHVLAPPIIIESNFIRRIFRIVTYSICVCMDALNLIYSSFCVAISKQPFQQTFSDFLRL